MDWIFEIMAIADKSKREKALILFRELQNEFHSYCYNQAKIDRLENQLYKLTENYQ
jgi:hypothetical protein